MKSTSSILSLVLSFLLAVPALGNTATVESMQLNHCVSYGINPTKLAELEEAKRAHGIKTCKKATEDALTAILEGNEEVCQKLYNKSCEELKTVQELALKSLEALETNTVETFYNKPFMIAFGSAFGGSVGAAIASSIGTAIGLYTYFAVTQTQFCLGYHKAGQQGRHHDYPWFVQLAVHMFRR
jgi:hypothetical protein